MAVFWQPQISVANRLLDAEHKYLFCLINAVEYGLGQPAREGLLAMAQEELETYTREHFADEERLQLKVRYAGYADHKVEHQRILESLEAVKRRVHHSLAGAEGEQTAREVLPDDLGEALVGLLRQWIVDHVLKMDMKMRPALAAAPPTLMP